jgi:hypothetical protein
MRTLVDLPDDDVQWLDRKANSEGTSRAAVVRQAISQYRASEGRKGIERYFDLWKDRDDVGDGLEYQRRLRSEWDRDGDRTRRE